MPDASSAAAESQEQDAADSEAASQADMVINLSLGHYPGYVCGW